MKTRFIKAALAVLVSMSAIGVLSAQSFSVGVNRAEKLTEKGFIDKKSTFDPVALDSLLKCDDYVMLISSYEGCGPCEWLRTSDVFDKYPITPYYTDFFLNSQNETVPYTFYVSGFPTCMYFDRNGEIVAVTMGTKDLYEKLDRVVKNGENLCEHRIKGVDDAQILPFLNLMHKANSAYMRGDLESMSGYAAGAMEIFPNFYNRYLSYKYHQSKGDTAAADQYKTLALENASKLDDFIYKKLIAELKGEEAE